ncbi:hypothetical protein WJX73_005974 [Symbiochloris irregularis]|uniref:Uncharacterized protein n=1 Tax=Symbiochloris irregularis TaxID=706552 RepID=A0AAW1PWH0_9CHLO
MHLHRAAVLCSAAKRSRIPRRAEAPELDPEVTQLDTFEDEAPLDADLTVSQSESADDLGILRDSQQGETSTPSSRQLVSSYPVSTAPESHTDLKLPALGALALLALAGLAYVFRDKLKRAPAPPGFDALSKGVQQVQLQREAGQRLNVLMDEMRNSPKADLSAKNLGDPGAQYVVEALAFNTTCLQVDLSKNGIGPEGAAALCVALGSNNVLQTLALDTNSIGDDGASNVAQYISTNASLEHVNLSGNGISDTGATVLAEMLKINKTLTNLELNSNTIDYDGTKALASAIAENTTLTSLSISDNYVGALGASTLANALRANTGIRRLYLRGNDMGDEGVKALCAALAARSTPLTHLDLANNNMTEDSAGELAALLKQGHLEELNIYSNDLGDGGIFKMAEAIKVATALTLLDLGGNNIGPDGMSAVAGVLKGHTALRTLELASNPIGEEGSRALADLLKFELQVENLRLGWCKLGSGKAAEAIADLLQLNTTLKVVDLRGNNLKDPGALYVARALRELTNEGLQELDLGYNEITDEGACQLALALKNNPMNVPREFKINANYLQTFGQTALVDALDMVADVSGTTDFNILL